jgi:sulfonate transport system permease protein
MTTTVTPPTAYRSVSEPDVVRPTTHTLVRSPGHLTEESGRKWTAAVWSRLHWLGRFASLAALLVLWGLATSLHWVGPGMVPSPLSVADAFGHLVANGQLETALWSSVQRVLKGLLVGGGIGLVFGLAAGLSRIGEAVLDAPLQAARMLPVLVMLYFFILWFGTGTASQVAVIALATFFPLYLNTFAGVRNVDRRLVEAGSAFGLHGFGMLRRVIFPASLPSILTGLRQSLGVAWFALIFVEQVNTSSGIGALILNAENISLQVNVMVVGLLLYAGIGLAADLLVRLIERRTLAWRSTFSGT